MASEPFSHYEDEAEFDSVDPLTFPDRPVIPTQDAIFERVDPFTLRDEWWIGGKKLPMDYEWDKYGEGGSMLWALTILLLLIVVGIFMVMADSAVPF